MVHVREKVRVFVHLGEYDVYTHRRTHDSCYWLSATLRFSNPVEKNLIDTRLDMRSDFLVVGDKL